MTTHNSDPKGQPGANSHWAEAALFGLCPKCGENTLFEGVAVIAPKCTDCGLDYAKLSAGDGSGALLTAVIAVGLIGLATGVDVAFAPPMWVHVMLWIPVTFAAVCMALRGARASMIHSAYRDNLGSAK